MKTKNYEGRNANVDDLVRELSDFFHGDDYDVEINSEPSGKTLRVKKASRVRVLTGFSLSLTVRITINPTGTRIQIGKQKWLDKAIMGTVCLLVFPLIGIVLGVVPGLGAYFQYKLTENTWNFIDIYMASIPRTNQMV